MDAPSACLYPWYNARGRVCGESTSAIALNNNCAEFAGDTYDGRQKDSACRKRITTTCAHSCARYSDHYLVEEAADGEEALHLLLTKDVDFIISDPMMPGDGWSGACI